MNSEEGLDGLFRDKGIQSAPDGLKPSIHRKLRHRTIRRIGTGLATLSLLCLLLISTLPTFQAEPITPQSLLAASQLLSDLFAPLGNTTDSSDARFTSPSALSDSTAFFPTSDDSETGVFVSYNNL
ncbi:MAG: hypothetical protein A2293_16465 [Elusimicrobia bacterium RIFOXYB2_FULL_49_7]|nr:MAG: hypothetical protein A2293_16465 [Elusimicrobia bacterium RIFOXYB2_FULL_49_7]